MQPATPRTAAVRRFNRFYTRRIGVLHERLADTRFSLAESRLLWEFAHRPRATATELARDLGLDAGYLSRLLKGLKAAGLIQSERSSVDGRHLNLQLSAAGKRAFAPLDRKSEAGVAALLSRLTEPEQQALIEAMDRIETLLGAGERAASPWLLRPLRPGDLGWIVQRHGAIYAAEHGWDMRFEALVARIGGDIVEHLDPARETGWIAERDGVNVGCVCLVQARDETTRAPVAGTAQLRLLLVEPAARGTGIGKRLVAECERFARASGYRRIVLWTNSVLDAARGIYAASGYTLARSEPHERFGRHLIGETWEKTLA